MDGRLAKSRTSIQSDIGETLNLSAYHDYVVMMEEKYENVSKLLEIAEQLIEKYEYQNNDLKKTNEKLIRNIIELNALIQSMKKSISSGKDLQFQNQIIDLTKRDDKVGRQIKGLAEELYKSETKIAKLTRQKHEKIEKSLHHFFEFPTTQIERVSKQQQLNRLVRSLKWKLQQKDQQIMYMIKRNKMLQENKSTSTHKNFRKIVEDDRFYTCQTEPSKNFK